MSSFWAPGSDEVAQGTNAVGAARAAGVRHFVWSTLPNVDAISGGEFDVAHFTNKAKVDAIVHDGGFDSFTFVEAPFYFENLLTNMAPQALPDGRTGWALPMPAGARVVHMGSIADILNSQGHSIAVAEVPADMFATFFPGAQEMAQMMGYWQKYTYLGPAGDDAIAAAGGVSTTPSTPFAAWASANMPAPSS